VEPSEEPQLDDVCGPRVRAFEVRQGVVEHQQIFVHLHVLVGHPPELRSAYCRA
jgi:hypothetical protein